MSTRSLIGMFGFDSAATEVDGSGRGMPASLEATYLEVLAVVGANHHLVQREDEDGARIVDNDALAQHRWWGDRAGAVAAFDAYKAKRVSARK